ncbi:hypothetical protein J25TS5_19920 [Paenibacillus faecis]|nr:hypothetical protein J25TS5_19920 [Paenibacillus faecis]
MICLTHIRAEFSADFLFRGYWGSAKKSGSERVFMDRSFLYFEPGVIGMKQIVRQIKPEVEGGYRKRERWDEKLN